MASPWSYDHNSRVSTSLHYTTLLALSTQSRTAASPSLHNAQHSPISLYVPSRICNYLPYWFWLLETIRKFQVAVIWSPCLTTCELQLTDNPHCLSMEILIPIAIVKWGLSVLDYNVIYGVVLHLKFGFS